MLLIFVSVWPDDEVTAAPFLPHQPLFSRSLYIAPFFTRFAGHATMSFIEHLFFTFLSSFCRGRACLMTTNAGWKRPLKTCKRASVRAAYGVWERGVLGMPALSPPVFPL